MSSLLGRLNFRANTLRLRRLDGKYYLRRRGFSCRWFGVFLHRMDAPDPGPDPHDHPWTFGSLVLWGGYQELRAPIRDSWSQEQTWRKWLSWRILRLDECHTIYALDRTPTFTLVVHGPLRREWGFYVDEEFIVHDDYDGGLRRELLEEE